MHLDTISDIHTSQSSRCILNQLIFHQSPIHNVSTTSRQRIQPLFAVASVGHSSASKCGKYLMLSVLSFVPETCSKAALRAHPSFAYSLQLPSLAAAVLLPTSFKKPKSAVESNLMKIQSFRRLEPEQLRLLVLWLLAFLVVGRCGRLNTGLWQARFRRTATRATAAVSLPLLWDCQGVRVCSERAIARRVDYPVQAVCHPTTSRSRGLCKFCSSGFGQRWLHPTPFRPLPRKLSLLPLKQVPQTASVATSIGAPLPTFGLTSHHQRTCYEQRGSRLPRWCLFTAASPQPLLRLG